MHAQQEISDRLQAIEHQLHKIDHAVNMPAWKKIVYGLGLTFLTVSTVRYWIDKADKQPPAYVLPCVAPTLEVKYAK